MVLDVTRNQGLGFFYRFSGCFTRAMGNCMEKTGKFGT